MTISPDTELLKSTEEQAIQKVLDAVNEPALKDDLDTLLN